MNTVLLLKDANKNIVAVYNDKVVLKKLLPVIEAKLLINIEEIEEVLLNPPIDLVGNKNFNKISTVEEFIKND